MSNILLIHGSCHGAWCWRDLIPQLQTHGHTVRAIDLPSHGDDKTPYSQVTLDSYVNAILDTLDAPTILVGHSMGGYPITLAAERAPDLVQKLIYVCAYIPIGGRSLSEMRMQAPYQPLLPHIRMTEDRKGWDIAPEEVRDLFYHDCPDEIVRYAQGHLCVQATAPTAVPVQTTARSTDIPRRYIRCADDRTIPPEFQVTMTEDWPTQHVVTMQCAHSPFFADPVTLARHIDTFTKD